MDCVHYGDHGGGVVVGEGDVDGAFGAEGGGFSEGAG